MVLWTKYNVKLSAAATNIKVMEEMFKEKKLMHSIIRAEHIRMPLGNLLAGIFWMMRMAASNISSPTAILCPKCVGYHRIH